MLFVDRTHSGLVNFSPDFPARIEAPLTPAGDSISMRVLVDRLSVEVFADDGRIVSTNLVFPPANANKIESFGGKIAAVVQAVRSTH
jgi:levanase